MKFEVEIDFDYPGIENDTPEMVQHNLRHYFTVVLIRGMMRRRVLVLVPVM